MASYRKPKGTVIRAVPDWNLSNCASIVVLGTEAPASVSEYGLFNDALDGRSLVIWSAAISHWAGGGGDPAQMVAGFQLEKTAGLTPYTPNTPLDPLVGALPGSGWFNGTSAGFLPTGVLGPTLKGNANWQWPHNWPMCVVRPGFSLSVVGVPPAAGFAASAIAFFWEAVRAI